MNKSFALILGIVLFVAGAAAGRAFKSDAAVPAGVPVVRTAAPSPVAPGPDSAAELARVRAELAELKRAVEPLQETDQKLRPILEAVPDARSAVSVDADGPAGVADLLGLDPVRQAALVRTHDETMRKIRAAEERHARAKKDGKITEITVAAFPEEGKALAREWSLQLDGLLSPQEREKYRKYSMERSLFPMGLEQFGAMERTITVTRSGGSVSVNEVSSGRGGNWSRSSSGGESVLDPIRHLLQAGEGR